MKDVYYENYETLTKEVEDDTKNGKTFHVCGLEELILLKCPYYQKQLQVYATPTIIPMTFFTKLEEIILKFIQNPKYPKWPT